MSIGTFNAQQQSDIHAYWEFNRGTDWTFPAYELPFTGGIPGTFEAGQVGALSSVVPGSGPAGVKNNPVDFGDAPDNPRDPDRFLDTDPAHKKQAEGRLRFIPSELANEVFLDVFERVHSFEPGVGCHNDCSMPMPRKLLAWTRTVMALSLLQKPTSMALPTACRIFDCTCRQQRLIASP